ncbi:MAG: hypothetical protein WCP34_12850 [Pseudomonadota bacterium]
MRTTLAILLLAAALGCSNPMNTKLPQDLSKMESIKPSVDKLGPEDKELFGAYIMRHLVASSQGASPIPAGMTIGKCIQDQKAYVQEHGSEEAARKSRTGSPALKKK